MSPTKTFAVVGMYRVLTATPSDSWISPPPLRSEDRIEPRMNEIPASKNPSPRN